MVHGPFTSVADVPDALWGALSSASLSGDDCPRPFFIEVLPSGHYLVFDDRRKATDRRVRPWGRRREDTLECAMTLRDMQAKAAATVLVKTSLVVMCLFAFATLAYLAGCFEIP